MTSGQRVQFWVLLVGGTAQLAWSVWAGRYGAGFWIGLFMVLGCLVAWEETRFRRREYVAAHAGPHSPQDATPSEWARRHPQDA